MVARLRVIYDMNYPFKIAGLWMFILCAPAQGYVQAAQSYIMVDAQTGHILAGSQQNEKRPVASLTKVAAALVVLDWAKLKSIDLSTLAEVPSLNPAQTGESAIGLQAGDRVSLRDLLYCSLLASDNVAASTLAATVGAQLPASNDLSATGVFVSHMNALARSLGMRRTLFLNPTGFDNVADGTAPYSTAADMARLTRYAYDDGGFPFYVKQPTRQVHVLRNGVDSSFEIKNTNELLGREEIDGVKTGRTRRAGDCLILSADRAPESRREGEKVFVTPRRTIVVLLASPDRFGDGLVLLRQSWNLYDRWAAQGRKTNKSQSL